MKVIRVLTAANPHQSAFARLGWLTFGFFAVKGLVYLGAAAASLSMMW